VRDEHLVEKQSMEAELKDKLEDAVAKLKRDLKTQGDKSKAE